MSLVLGEMMAQRVYRLNELSISREGTTTTYRLAQNQEPLSGYVKIISGATKYTVATLHKGVLDDTYTEYLHGKIALQGQYSMGIRIGKWQEYYPSESLRRESYYEAGALQGEVTTYYTSGIVERKLRYKQNLREGAEEVYDATGRAVGVYHWQADNRQGTFWKIDESGDGLRSRTQGAYESGKLHGKWICEIYDTHGKHTHTIERHYKHGDLIEERQQKP